MDEPSPTRARPTTRLGCCRRQSRPACCVDVEEGTQTPLPYAEGDFDLALVDAVSAPVAMLLPEIRRVLRSGGRVVLVIRQKVPQAPAPADVLHATSAHFRGARVLYERDGLAIVEALKGQPIQP